jgi:antitoxin component YwqK of YwqJK toxin-antitoxin module
MNLIKTTICLIFLSLGLSQCKQEKSEQISKYASGTISKRIAMVDGKKHGEMIEYYNTGEIMSRSQFVNDKQTGKAVYFYPSGKLKEIQYLENFKLQNGDTSFYENGNIEFIVEYANGLKNGYVKKFDSTGVMYFDAKYKMDTLVEVKGVVLQR